MTELTIDQALQQGVEAHKAGQVQEADRLYTAILKAQPKHPDANHNMGVLAVGVGKVQEALPFFKTALEANPATAQFWLSYIDALIKLEKLADAKAVLDQAKSKGAKGDGFDKLEQRLKDAGQEPIKGKQVASEPQLKQPNILDTLKLDQAISLAKKKAKDGSPEEAKRIYQDILTKFPKNKRASDGLKGLVGRPVGKASKVQEPPQAQTQALINLYSQGQLQQALQEAGTLVQQFPQSAILFNIQGAVLKGLGQLDASVEAYNKALAIKPDNADAYNNMGVTLQEQGKLEEAIEAYNKALAIKPNYAEAYYNMGNALKDQGKLEEAIEAYNKALDIKPDHAEAYKNMGVTLQDQGKLEEAIEAYNKAIIIKPDNAEAYYNMGIVLKDQGKLEEAIEAYNKALDIKPDFAEAYGNMGTALADQGKLEEAIEAYNKALNIKPDFAEAYGNMGIVLKDQGKPVEAIEAYNKSLAIKPDYAEAYNNMGNALKEQGKLEEAIEAYNKALSIKPGYAEAHRNLSLVTKYNSDTAQISEVKALLQRTGLNDSDRCKLLYTHAKMQEDLGDLSDAFDSYVAGGGLRQTLLGYEFTQDEHLFGRIKQKVPQFKDVALNVTGKPITHTPIFILGMPRSGTTLVEQIVSSHTEVTGAGELAYVSQFGTKLVAGATSPTLKAVSVFRERYLTELAKRAEGQAFVTDKMPHNFRYIALICAAFPEAKIVHVQRNAEATCWSNFKHYFVSKDLGYSYDLRDTVKYYGLYKDLMHFWSQSYSDRIYNLDYDKLTEDQESETRGLIEYLELNWEDACLAPQNNKRSVKTASQQQVRQKVYKGSSQAWRKYEPFLGGVFDGLEAY
ncbi:tetratricopeptide repeat protein [Planktomarina temperata]|uniref:UDP-N-acetylglucosamine--peptide N-acetylglucosaminyltransferase 110 kDa subunit n=1 Tax=Planktomarina temperata RCA23 TaxID=666509 RepID=A0AAN0RKM2_9RHOB|nr:UDP-N-acetylglucosamine--peptide N-acetylglucosaminyltransferase 110 kDa subunit [Planktomarina temperata RCA23]